MSDEWWVMSDEWWVMSDEWWVMSDEWWVMSLVKLFWMVIVCFGRLRRPTNDRCFIAAFFCRLDPIYNLYYMYCHCERSEAILFNLSQYQLTINASPTKESPDMLSPRQSHHSRLTRRIVWSELECLKCLEFSSLFMLSDSRSISTYYSHLFNLSDLICLTKTYWEKGLNRMLSSAFTKYRLLS